MKARREKFSTGLPRGINCVVGAIGAYPDAITPDQRGVKLRDETAKWEREIKAKALKAE